MYTKAVKTYLMSSFLYKKGNTAGSRTKWLQAVISVFEVSLKYILKKGKRFSG